MQLASRPTPLCDEQTVGNWKTGQRKMERYSSPFSVVPSSHQFQRVISITFIGVILIILTQFYTVRAAIYPPSPTATTTKIDDISSVENRRRSIVDPVVNSTGTELGTFSSNRVDVRDDVEAMFHRRHHHRRRFQTSSYVKASLLRTSHQHQHQHQQKQSKLKQKDVRNLRKLSSNSGCMTDPTVCLTAPGWTTESFASTCCHTGWCTDIHFDGLNCGGCGNPCQVGYFCCSGVCVATESDPRNCGRCDNDCQGGTCDFGLCGYSTIDLIINSTDS